MARKLPDDSVKRRKQYFKRLYQHLHHWRELRQSQGMSDIVVTPEAEEIYMGDLLIGLDDLPPRQREAFELVCLLGYTETAAKEKMLPNSKSSSPIQEYVDTALTRMIRAYDAKQDGTWVPKKKPSGRSVTADED